LRVRGINSSQKEVSLKEANITSAINGTKVEMEVSVGTEIVSVGQIELIPTGALIELVAKFGPPDPIHPGKILGIDAKEFIETWRQFSFNATDDSRSYRLIFGESNLAPFFPGLVGPHIAKKTHQNGN
jgi:hypothetical protein